MMRDKKNYLLFSLFTAITIFSGCKKDDVFKHAAGAAMTIDDFTARQGGGGTEILITGSNFSMDTSEIEVTINGNQLAVIGANGNQIMAVVPKKMRQRKCDCKNRKR